MLRCSEQLSEVWAQLLTSRDVPVFANTSSPMVSSQPRHRDTETPRRRDTETPTRHCAALCEGDRLVCTLASMLYSSNVPESAHRPCWHSATHSIDKGLVTKDGGKTRAR